MITADVQSVYHHGKWALVLRGLVGIAMGIFILARPLQSVAAFAVVIAFWALVDGIVNIVQSFELRSIAPHWWAMLLGGVVSVIFGVAALYYYPVLSLAFAVAWSALWLLTLGVAGVYVAIQERRAGLHWAWMMTFGIVAIIGGVLAFRNPGTTLAALMVLLATFGIIGGIVMLVGAGKMQSFEHDVKHTLHTAARA